MSRRRFAGSAAELDLMADYVKAEEEVEKKSRGTASGGPKLSDDEEADVQEVLLHEKTTVAAAKEEARATVAKVAQVAKAKVAKAKEEAVQEVATVTEAAMKAEAAAGAWGGDGCVRLERQLWWSVDRISV